jgi:hypothetical protein
MLTDLFRRTVALLSASGGKDRLRNRIHDCRRPPHARPPYRTIPLGESKLPCDHTRFHPLQYFFCAGHYDHRQTAYAVELFDAVRPCALF